MPAFVPNQGEATLLSYIRSVMQGAPSGKAVHLRLFTNNYTPVPGSVEADFTEATFKGYASPQLDVWAAPVADGNGQLIAAEQKSFVYDSGAGGASSEDVYGAWVRDADGNVLAAELFAGGPFEMSNDTHEIKYTAKIKLTEQTEACA